MLTVTLAAVLLGACYLPMDMQGAPRVAPPLGEPSREPVVRSRRGRSTTSAAVEKQGLLTVGDIVWALLRRNPKLRVLRQKKRILDTAKDTVRRFENPELRIMNLSSDLAKEKHGGLSIRLRWSPPFPGAYRARRTQAAALAHGDAQKLNLMVFELIARARDLHACLVITHRRIAARRRLLAILRQQWDHRRKQVAAGVISQLKADLSELATLNSKRRIAALESTRARLQGQLRTMLQLKRGQRIATRAKASARPVTPLSTKILVRQALAQHPALAALQARYKARHAALWLAKSKRYPWIDFVQAGYDFGEESLPARFQFGIGITLPILDGNSGRIKQERQRLSLLKAQTKALRRQLAAEVKSRRLAVSATYKALHRYRTITRPKLDKIRLRAEGAAKREGVDLNEVFRVRSLVARFELARLDQLLAFRRAQIRLDLAVARPVWRAYGIRLGKRKK